MLTQSQDSIREPPGMKNEPTPGLNRNLGWFQSTAPGMFPILVNHTFYCITYDSTTVGSGNWSRLNAPADSIESSVYNNMQADGSNTSFIDGHAKFMKAAALAAGTNYMIVDKFNKVEGAEIINRDPYLWNLNDNYYCENLTTPGCQPGL